MPQEAGTINVSNLDAAGYASVHVGSEYHQRHGVDETISYGQVHTVYHIHNHYYPASVSVTPMPSSPPFAMPPSPLQRGKIAPPSRAEQVAVMTSADEQRSGGDHEGLAEPSILADIADATQGSSNSASVSNGSLEQVLADHILDPVANSAGKSAAMDRSNASQNSARSEDSSVTELAIAIELDARSVKTSEPVARNYTAKASTPTPSLSSTSRSLSAQIDDPESASNRLGQRSPNRQPTIVAASSPLGQLALRQQHQQPADMFTASTIRQICLRRADRQPTTPATPNATQSLAMRRSSRRPATPATPSAAAALALRRADRQPVAVPAQRDPTTGDATSAPRGAIPEIAPSHNGATMALGSATDRRVEASQRGATPEAQPGAQGVASFGSSTSTLPPATRGSDPSRDDQSVPQASDHTEALYPEPTASVQLRAEFRKLDISGRYVTQPLPISFPVITTTIWKRAALKQAVITMQTYGHSMVCDDIDGCPFIFICFRVWPSICSGRPFSTALVYSGFNEPDVRRILVLAAETNGPLVVRYNKAARG
ncbi:hypothetical protein B0A48_10730 [Cryoendolithus antarcticus]|uniref:Uncharacterized protein n=1 Tax=Cryoendolithus antarcticus TaxID=1507870 RepID=A0A1V8SYM2_9PEZI|nr:hypothetical protein B0A48_10730 [Cryoendolithus antarcticus]